MFAKLLEGLMKKIAVITSVRNDQMFKEKWIEYYAEQFGAGNLFMIIDGEDQPLPPEDSGINVIVVPFVPREVVAGEKSRAARASDLAKTLFDDGYDMVISTDIDEFLVLDPNVNSTLAQYLTDLKFKGVVSGLGLDVIENSDVETAIDPSKKFLDQRKFAMVSHRYTKAAIINQPLRWGSGQHRVKGKNFRIDPNLYMFHFGNIDRGFSTARLQDKDRQEMNWTKHQIKREQLYEDVRNADALDGDERFVSARRYMTWRRPLYAWNKPGVIKKDAVIRIPDRFAGIV